LEDGYALTGKKILVVDDEPDVLEIIEEILHMCVIHKAGSFEEARKCLDENVYDAAILDIMGVRGYDLLDITTRKNVPTLMLTAHALSPENFARSLEGGAFAYVPKDALLDIEFFLQDILEAHEKGSRRMGKWFDRLEVFFQEKFGAYWKEKMEEGPEFWQKYI